METSRASFADAVNAAYAAAAGARPWSAALETLGDHVGAGGALLAYANARGQGDLLEVGRLREDLSQPYLNRYARNPLALAIARAPHGQMLVASRLVESNQLRRTEFHADILHPQAIEDQIAMVHPSLAQRGDSGGFAFTLRARDLDQREALARRAQRLAPHLTQALDIWIAAGARASVQQVVRQLTDMLPGAVALVDHQRRLVRLNAAAENLLIRGRGLAIDTREAGELTAASPADRPAFTRALAAALQSTDGEVGRPAVLRLSSEAGEEDCIVLITPLPRPDVPLWPLFDGLARAVVQVIDLRARATDEAGALERAFKLTAAEARVARLVRQGRTGAEIARLLGVSTNTVRTHLSRCFDKTGVRSQVGLARLLAAQAEAPRQLPPHPIG